MRYISTRGAAPELGFMDAMLAGLARDGGLYVPDSIPVMPAAAISGLSGLPYFEVAVKVIQPYVGDEIPADDLVAMTEAAYRDFRHASKAPLTQLDDNIFLLELYHGPTLAFKDFAMQWLGKLINYALQHRGARATILGATSGDTGAAAIEAFGGNDTTDVFILFPHGRVSEIQRKQMTTVGRAGVHAIAIEGNFDDCQNIVKSLFGDISFRDSLSLAGVNSINWARVLAQIVYYFFAAVALGAPDRKLSFAVPTGNFGDVLAGYYAKRMGLPIDRLVVATNENDILARALDFGAYKPRGVIATSSPSMDIQVSSNFERALFEAYQRDPNKIGTLMNSLKQNGEFRIHPSALEILRRDFDATCVTENVCADEIRRCFQRSGEIVDPHTAVGVSAARAARGAAPETPVIALATAHAAKFPDAVFAATGVQIALPSHLSELASKPERFDILPNDANAVANFIRRRARAAA